MSASRVWARNAVEEAYEDIRAATDTAVQRQIEVMEERGQVDAAVPGDAYINRRQDRAAEDAAETRFPETLSQDEVYTAVDEIVEEYSEAHHGIDGKTVANLVNGLIDKCESGVVPLPVTPVPRIGEGVGSDKLIIAEGAGNAAGYGFEGQIVITGEHVGYNPGKESDAELYFFQNPGDVFSLDRKHSDEMYVLRSSYGEEEIVDRIERGGRVPQEAFDHFTPVPTNQRWSKKTDAVIRALKRI